MAGAGLVRDDLRGMDELLRRTAELHSAPQVAHSILNLTRHADYDVREVVECLATDPALAARILRVVNSSHYGLSQQVTSLRQAVALLGQRQLRLVAVTFSIVDRLTRGAAANLYAAYWRRSLTIATVASKLTARTSGGARHEAYVAGLLADVGALVLATAHTGVYVEICAATPHGIDLVERERQRFGFGHPALGGRLLRQWGFPGMVIDAAAHHHDQRGQALPLEVAVRAADRVADLLWTPESPQFCTARRQLEEEFDIPLDGLIELATWTQSEVTANAELFGIALREPVDSNGPRQRLQIYRSQHDADETKSNTAPAKELPKANPRAIRVDALLWRDSEPGREPLQAELAAWNLPNLGLHASRPLRVGEGVRMRLVVSGQLSRTEHRGAVASVHPEGTGRFRIIVVLHATVAQQVVEMTKHT